MKDVLNLFNNYLHEIDIQRGKRHYFSGMYKKSTEEYEKIRLELVRGDEIVGEAYNELIQSVENRMNDYFFTNTLQFQKTQEALLLKLDNLKAFCDKAFEDYSKGGIHSDCSEFTFALINDCYYDHSRLLKLLKAIPTKTMNAGQRNDQVLKEKKTRKSKIVAIEEESKTKGLIKEKFNEVDNSKGWKYIFRTETDFETYSELLSRYFGKKEYKTPTETIQVQRGCKTRLANSLGRILRGLSFYKKLSDDTDYFELVRVLAPFKEETDTQIYKAITREKE